MATQLRPVQPNPDPLDSMSLPGWLYFDSEFFEAEKGATRAQAIAAWRQLKRLDLPKNYASWSKARANRQKTRRLR